MNGTYFTKDPDTKQIQVVAYLTPDFDRHYGNRWWLNRIEVMRGTPKGQGLGTKLLQHICAEADMQRAELWLGVDSDMPGYFRRLVRWYTRHGFTPVKRPLSIVNNVMRREPCNNPDSKPSTNDTP